MAIFDGDWRENFSEAGTTREVVGRELVYSASVTGFTVSMQALVGGTWSEFDSLTADTLPKEQVYANPKAFRAVVSGTGTATIILSPSRPLPNENLPTQIAQNVGTAIGDMTLGGGLAAAFDETESQAAAASARVTGAAVGYVGKFWLGLAKTIRGVRVVGSSDEGIYGGAGSPLITINVRGANTDAGPSGGTVVASFSFTDTNGVDQSLFTGFDETTPYLFHWVEITHGEVVAALNLAEVVFYE